MFEQKNNFASRRKVLLPAGQTPSLLRNSLAIILAAALLSPALAKQPDARPVPEPIINVGPDGHAATLAFDEIVLTFDEPITFNQSRNIKTAGIPGAIPGGAAAAILVEHYGHATGF